MPLIYNDAQRRAYLAFSAEVGTGWMEMFEGDTEFYSAAYWDLFKALWLSPDPIRKTDAARTITGVKSPLTAAKYIETAVKRGLVTEQDNPNDARSKLLALSPQLRAKMDAFFDNAVDGMRKATTRLADLGPVPF